MASGFTEPGLSVSTAMTHPAPVCEDRCPLCGQANACTRAFGADPGPAPCWCESVDIPSIVLAGIPAALQGKACLCAACARADLGASPPPPRPEEADTYFTPDGRMVFTRAYHLRRGYCCGSGCRHCPFDGTESRP